MKAPLHTLSSEEILSISPEIRAKVREAVTPRRPQATALNAIVSDDADILSMALPYAGATIEEIDDEDAPSIPSTSSGKAQPSYTILQRNDKSKAAPFVIPDPVETYLSSLGPDETPLPVIVAKESHALRSIYALIDNKEQIECVLDGGSQIIAMSEEVCHALGLAYDPTVKISLQSANSTYDLSLGISRNVAFQVSDMTIYLQVHVVRDAAYDILLGRPFEVLTTSHIRNFANEDQTVEIHCPNTQQVVTVPTLPRGKPRFRRRGDFLV